MLLHPKDRYSDYELVRIIQLNELKSTLRELIHIPTGAKILHIENEDPENVFCLSFKTLPDSSNGVAHILEHTVLCGSKKYPIKDPFFAMTRRSLNTFMNALTGQDFTCYPAASLNQQDFYNLLEVYIDAVFHPELNELSFRQEGHRLEFEKMDDPNSPLVIRGIVYNEMKGAMNSGSSRMHEFLYQALFPHSTYGVNSGGDPKEISSLSYLELLEFHRKFYHPSRCLFYFYGNIPLKTHLDFIQDKILEKAGKVKQLDPIPLQYRYIHPASYEGKYPVSVEQGTENKTLISIAWLTAPLMRQEECLAIEVIEMILLDNDASPLKKALLRSELCKQVFSYVDDDINEMPFIIHLQGCTAKSREAIDQVIQNTLKQVVREGIAKEAIDQAIHQLEFHRSEITGDHYPFGLTLFMRSGLLMQHGGDPAHGLLIHSLFDSLREKIEKNPHYLTQLIEKYLIQNPHKVITTLLPDTELEEKEQEEERKKLEAIKGTFSDTQKELLVKNALELKAFQRKQEEGNKEILPKIHLNEVSKKIRQLPLQIEKLDAVELYYHSCFTNEICYIDLTFDCPFLTHDELLYARLLTIVLCQMGAQGKSYEEMLALLHANTGGVHPYLSLNIDAKNFHQFTPSFGLRGKALYRKVPELCNLMKGFIESPILLDRARIREILHKHFTSLENSITTNALKYAMSLASSGLNAASYISDQWFGLDYYHFVRNLTQDLEHHLDTIMEKLHQVHLKLTQCQTPHLILTCDDPLYKQAKQDHFYGLTSIKTLPTPCGNFNIQPRQVLSQGRVIASPVAFVTHTFSTVPYADRASPHLNLAGFLFDNLTLHQKIREEGGAYGGGANCNVMSGNFFFYSYRDPHIASSLSAFQEAIEGIRNLDFTDEDLEEAKFEMLQQMDSPISPGSRGITAYCWLREHKTPEMRQNFRDLLLNATKEEVAQVVKTHIVPNYDSGTTVVFGGRQILERENALLKETGKALPIIPLNEMRSP